MVLISKDILKEMCLKATVRCLYVFFNVVIISLNSYWLIDSLLKPLHWK